MQQQQFEALVERGQLRVKVSAEIVALLREGKLTLEQAQIATGASYKHLYNIKLGHKR